MTKSPIDKAHDIFKRAWIEESKNNLENAIKLINDALSLAPTSSVYWTTKGQFLLELGDYEGAQLAAQKSVNLKPENYHGWSLLGEIYADKREFHKAANCFTKSLKLKPDYSTYTLLAAVEYEFDPANAIAHAKKALEFNSEWADAKTVIQRATEKLASKGRGR